MDSLPAPWIQFLFLYVLVALILNLACEKLTRLSVALRGNIFARVILVFVDILSLIPFVFAVYFTVYYVDGLWNILLWAYTLLVVIAIQAQSIVGARNAIVYKQ